MQFPIWRVRAEPVDRRPIPRSWSNVAPRPSRPHHRRASLGDRVGSTTARPTRASIHRAAGVVVVVASG